MVRAVDFTAPAGATEAESRQTRTVADAYLAMLADRGVSYLFGNAGTDFAPVIEAYAKAAETGTPTPRPILAAHESLAVGMAHGYAMLSRKIPAVMVHVSVGTANMVCGAMNAARENIGLLLTAGRTPINEYGEPGARDGYIHWAQEMYDQAGMLREFVKWDYELRNPRQLATVVDRALSIASSEPRGPVYLSLPREVLGAPSAVEPKLSSKLCAATPAAPDGAAIRQAADMLARADRPLIITANAGRERGAFSALAKFAEELAIPVIQHKPRYLSMPSTHPMNFGYDPARYVHEADLIIAIETDVPWIPSHREPPPDCKIIQCGLDPLFTGIPIRGFSTDLNITGATGAILEGLTSALDGLMSRPRIDARKKHAETEIAKLAAEREAVRQQPLDQTPLQTAWVSHCIGQAKPSDSIVVNEYSLLLDHCHFDQPDSYFGSSSASGLGWGAAAALGAKLAAPDQMVIAVLGDGAFMFSNPVAVHHASALHELPVLFVIINNSKWNAVHRSTVAMYPEGRYANAGTAPFVSLENLPVFEQICASSGGYGERVDTPEALLPALGRATRCVRDGRRQALLNVICGL